MNELEALARAATPDSRLTEEFTHGHYRVDQGGEVRSNYPWRGKPTNRKVAQTVNASGYPSVRIVLDGRRKHIAVHRLVALIWLGPRPSSEHEVRHLDGNRLNNKASNLCWGTVAENAQDRERHGRGAGPRNGRKSAPKITGERNPMAKMTDAEAADVKRRYRAGERRASIHADYPHIPLRVISEAGRGLYYNSGDEK